MKKPHICVVFFTSLQNTSLKRWQVQNSAIVEDVGRVSLLRNHEIVCSPL